MTRRRILAVAAALAVPGAAAPLRAPTSDTGVRRLSLLEGLRLAGRTSEAVGYRAGGREARPGRAAAGAKRLLPAAERRGLLIPTVDEILDEVRHWLIERFRRALSGATFRRRRRIERTEGSPSSSLLSSSPFD